MTEAHAWQTRAALVTGASRGIGRAIAERLVAQGLPVALTASPRSEGALKALAATLAQRGGRVVWHCADLAEPRSRADLLARTREALGQPILVLVNNAAGLPSHAPPSRASLADRQRLFELNVQAPLDLIQQALPDMQAAGFGRLLALGSEMVVQPPPPYVSDPRLIHGLALYGAAKAALERALLGLAAELDGSGITCSLLKPYRIVATEAAAAVVAQLHSRHPDWIEPVELMAEAAWQLIQRGCHGESVVSRALLRRLQQPFHSLDGRRVLGHGTDLWTAPG